MEDHTIITVTAICSITILEAIALMNRVDGALLATVFTIIGGLVGYKVKRKINKSREISKQ